MKKEKNIKSLLQEELVQSPGRTALKNFFGRKLSVVGMIIFVSIFIACFALSALYPIDLQYTDSTRMNLPPTFNYLAVPNDLRNNAKAIDLGATFGAGIDKQGKLHIWGTLTDKLKKVPENLPPLKDVSCGLDHIVVVTEDNKVIAWGNNRLGITRIPPEVQGKKIVDLQAGYQATMVLDEAGTVHFWGNESNFSINLYDYEKQIDQFALNVSTAIALTKDHKVVSLAKGESLFSEIPDSVQGSAVAVASTDNVGAALLKDGTVTTWGVQTADAYSVPEEIQGQVAELKGGRTHFTALLKDGSVYSWGENYFEQTNYPSVLNGTQIATDYYQNAVIDKDGKVTTWGQKGYLMGTDQWGRDVFKRVVHGGRVTMTVGFLSVLVSGIIGIIIGGISGYFGGWIDNLLMRFAEVVSAIPFIPLAIILASIVSGKVSETGRVTMIMIILGLLNWPGLARLTRAQILAEKENEFVTAAKAMGIKEAAIIFRHILPNVLAVVLVNLTLSMASCLLLESSLSFLGFGIIEPNPTWGNMLNKCIDSVVIKTYWWRWVFPSLALGLSTISINLMGDGFRDAIDPKSGER